jgi:2-dehydro-3-deoxygluconokinase
MAELVTFGEAMIRLTPPGFRRLEQANSLDVQVGGAELNTAVCAARLGHSSAWVSRLTDNPLGRLIAGQARAAGVDTSHIAWTPEGRVGLYFLEMGAAPRASSVLYDRKSSAIAAIQPGMIDWRKALAGARWLHTTGITPALSPSAAAVTLEGLKAAREMGLTTSIDLNYRVKLWAPEEAGACMAGLMPYTDVLITTEEDLQRVFGIQGKSHEEAAEKAARAFSLKAVVVTLRDNPLVWRNSWSGIVWHDGSILRSRVYEVEIVDRLGAGDSFAAGFIHGMLTGDVHKAVEWGAAVSALKHSIPGDFAWVTREEVESLLKGGGLRIGR